MSETGIKGWYVLRVFTGKEEAVKAFTLKEIKLAKLEQYFGEMLIPVETVIEMRLGKKREKKRTLFPGYLFVEMEVSPEVKHFLLNIPRIIGFADYSGVNIKGKEHEPQPLLTDEVDRLLGRNVPSHARTTFEVPFQVDDKVKINDGPFKDFVGSVKEINQDKRKLKVLVSIFGRITPVEVDILQVDAISGS